MNDEAYRGSHGEVSGMTREQHALQTNLIAQQLADEGLHVTVWEVV